MPSLSAPNSAVVQFDKPNGFLTVDCSSGATAIVSWSGPGGTSGQRTVRNISEDVGPFIDGTTANVRAVDGTCTYESSASSVPGEVTVFPAFGPAVSGQTLYWLGTPNPITTFGFNSLADGTQTNPASPSLVWNIESDFNDGSGANKMEIYIQYMAAGLSRICRPFFVSINRVTQKVYALILKSDVIRFLRDDGTAEGGTNMVSFAPNEITLHASDATKQTTLALQSAAGQPSSISFQFGGVLSGGLLTRSASSSAFTLFNSSGTGFEALIMHRNIFGTNTGVAVAVGEDSNEAALFGSSVNGPSNQASIIAKAKSNQSVPAFQVRDSTGTIKASADRFGVISVAQIAAASVASPSSGYIAIFMDTDGALKYKTSAGTVRALSFT